MPFGARKKCQYLMLLYKIYHREDHPFHVNLHHFVAVRNTRTSAVLGEIALVIPRCRTDLRLFLPVAVRL